MHKKIYRHYFHHFLFANLGLYIAYIVYGSITVWEIILFFFVTILPFIDELLYATLYYLESKDCRNIVNNFLAGEMTESLYWLHEKRIFFGKLLIHNLPVYMVFWSLWYFSFINDISILFYGLTALQTHLILDMINDKYEFNTVRKWIWPFRYST